MAQLRMIVEIDWYSEKVDFSCCIKGDDKPLFDCLGQKINPIGALLNYNVNNATHILTPYPIKTFSIVLNNYSNHTYREIENLTTDQSMALLIPKTLYDSSELLYDWLHDHNVFDDLERLKTHYNNYQGIPENYLMFVGNYLGDTELTQVSPNLC